jgi:hypothetical protein
MICSTVALLIGMPSLPFARYVIEVLTVNTEGH